MSEEEQQVDDVGALMAQLLANKRLVSAATAKAEALYEARKEKAAEGTDLDALHDECYYETIVEAARPYFVKLTHRPILSWGYWGDKAIQGIVTCAIAALAIGGAAAVSRSLRSTEETTETPAGETTNTSDLFPENTFSATSRPTKKVS